MNKIVITLIGITGVILLPVQIVTTFVLGLLVSLTFGLLLIPISLVWVILFLYPLLGLSYLYDRFVVTRPFIAIIGIPLAVLGDSYVSLMPSMGEMDSRYQKLILCQTFPYTWRFTQFQNNNLNIKKNDVLCEVLRDISRAKVLGKYLDTLRADVYSRPSCKGGELNW